jgi:osmotically-inducible protein OsmY
MIYAPADATISDADLKRRVVSFLFSQHVSDLRHLEVSAERGVVTVRGRVRSFYQRQVCVHCCQRVAGVSSIVDEIEVATPATAGSGRSDILVS